MSAEQVTTIGFEPGLPIELRPKPRPTVDFASFDERTRRWLRAEYRRIRTVLSPYETRTVLRLRADTMHEIALSALRSFEAWAS